MANEHPNPHVITELPSGRGYFCKNELWHSFDPVDGDKCHLCGADLLSVVPTMEQWEASFNEGSEMPISANETGSALTQPVWAVVADHYLNMNLTHDEARDEAQALRERKQAAVVVTNEAARRMVESTIGITVASMPDMKF